MNEYYYESYISDKNGVNGVNGITFKNINNENDNFQINVDGCYALYDRKGIVIYIKVVRIAENGKICYKRIKDFTNYAGELSRFNPNIRVVETENFMPMTDISGTNTTEPLFKVVTLHLAEGAIREGGRNKRGRKSKKYSKNTSKSRTRRGGRRHRRGATNKKYKKARKH